MKLDPVLAEIRQTREAYSERFGGDVRAMLDDLRKREQESGRKLVSRVTEPPAKVLEFLRKLQETKAKSLATHG